MPIHLKRNRLYLEVWSRPIGYLARDWGMTSAKLREVCKALQIPLPTVGHWAAARAGRQPDPPPLPDYEGPMSLTLDAEPRETLAEWVARGDRPPLKRATVRTATPARTLTGAPPRLVPVAVWASIVFGEHAPHANTLHRWVHDGRIYPPAKKVGRKWFVTPAAEYVGD